MGLNVPGFSLTPSSTPVALPSNYLTNFDFSAQYMPDIHEEEFAKYGNRSIGSLLRNLQAEIPLESDLVKWAEEGRLHTKYTLCTHGTYTAGTEVITLPSGTSNMRLNQVVFMSGSLGAEARGIVKAITTTTFTVAYYSVVSASPFATAETITVFVYGSEFQKGSNGMVGGNTSETSIYSTKPVIIKDKFIVSGSDMAQIGWIKVQTDGGAGYLWYLKSQSDTRARYEDQLEMMMIEHVPAAAGSAAETYLGGGSSGTSGLFDSVATRGNVWSAGNPSTLGDWDLVTARLDKQGAISENAIFQNRSFSNDVDDMLAAQSSVAGTSWGMFNNDKEMALNLGFSSFRRGSYEFYKSDWKYLNDAALRGGIVGGKVSGLLVPSGTKSVYDEVMGKTVTRPFLHMRYRKSQREDRKLKTWITGSAGGAETSDLDAMEVNYLSERCLVTLGANNFMTFK